jgi:hypothetical protein
MLADKVLIRQVELSVERKRGESYTLAFLKEK